jgi:predicted dehydrogenase
MRKLGFQRKTDVVERAVSWYQEAIDLAAQKNCRLFVSSSFLYRREIQYIAEFVQGQKVNYIYHSGQYLPDWHPWESYKDFFVAENRTNACREILAIELPWIISAFSPVESFHVMADRNSGLEIDFNDNYMISLQHQNGSKGVFCQDVISRKGLRRLEVYSENLHLFWEGTPQTLEIWDIDKRELKQVAVYDDVEQNPKYNSNIIEDMYKDELAAFFRYVEDGVEPSYSLADDSRTLALIDKIERAGNG